MTLPAPPAAYRGVWRTDEEALAVYSEAAGIARHMPRAVARPSDIGSVQQLAAWSNGHGVPLIPRGSGSSMAGGAVGDGVVVDLGALDAIGPVDAEARCIRVGAGAIRNAVDAAARAAGLRFAVDPSSGAFCTIGGMVGTNAAGARALAFGAMRDAVVALDCVFADGSRAELRRGQEWSAVPALADLARVRGDLHALATGGSFRRAGVRKESSGYAIDAFLATGDVVDLVVGSEGTLCLVVGAELALLALPAATSTVLASFGSLDDAVDAAIGARAAGAVACELLDRTFLEMARTGGGAAGVPREAEAVLIAEVESADAAAIDAQAERVVQRFRAHGASGVVTALGPAAEAELWELRHAASPTITRLHPDLRSMQFIEDGAVPAEVFAEYVRGVREILARHGLPGVIFGHAGDAHAHVNPLVDVARDGWREQVAAVLDACTALVARLGGTLAAEHGDGRLRTPLLDRVWDARARDGFAMVKRAVDPAGTLNPGVKIPLEGQRPLAMIKYDPAAPALPPRAAAVLHHVGRERAYGQSRLEMLEGVN